ncbi:MAG TPA: bifunctional alpha/beta hydrolase/OsmC family protein [Xanthobacteraceae bacterium]|nr:bifunctional alpha/beta hydrolase/OsmC family protein [Xanthobacteraceae bacterium]
MPAQQFDFPNASGLRLAGLLDNPAGEARAYALFAHCFTCGKDVHAAKRIAEGLTALGIAVLRFDFTGLGSSEGEFANTTFSSNVADLVAAADHLRRIKRAPAILIGHSLGGAAVLAAASAVPEARAVVTIAAPSDPAHVAGLFRDARAEIEAGGEVEVTLAGRAFRIRRAFLDDVAEQQLSGRINALHKALLIFHSPTDDIVGIDNASRIFAAARHPKSFVSLAGADHLLSRRSDAAYVANVIAAWAGRYLDMAPQATALPAGPPPTAAPAPTGDDEDRGVVIVRETGQGRFEQQITAGAHRLLADEPIDVGGTDSGPNPYDLLLAALGACTAMTLRLYAERKALRLDRVAVRLRHAKVHAADCETCESRDGKVDRIERGIVLEGELDAQQRARLLEIADKCPIHRTLTSGVDIATSELSDPP